MTTTAPPAPPSPEPGDRITFGNRSGTIFTVRGTADAPLYVVDFDRGGRSIVTGGPDTHFEPVPLSELPSKAPRTRARRERSTPPTGGESANPHGNVLVESRRP